jgi:hypothetical protein
MIVKAAITNGRPRRSRRSTKNDPGDFRERLDHPNRPERKKNIAMKKLSVPSTMASKPIHDLGSVWPKWV